MYGAGFKSKSYKALFDSYRDDTVLTRACKYAHWTLPQLMAGTYSDKHAKDSIIVERDFQEMGALLVNNLAPKLVTLLFPAARPFFKAEASEALLEEARKNGQKPVDVASALAKMEVDSCARLFLNGSYEQLITGLKHLIVTGNTMLYRDQAAAKISAYGLNSFVTKRDGRGNCMDTILREYTDFFALPHAAQAVIRTKQPTKYNDRDTGDNQVCLYTRILRVQGLNGKWYYKVSQEAEDVPVGEPGIYPEDMCPWIVPTWSILCGENYGRGLVEDYAGGFARLSDVSHASALYSIAASKVVNLVSGGQGADIDDLQAAETGEYVAGQKDGVTAFEGGDSKKMDALRTDVSELFSRLSRAFMYKGPTRDAERVTAFELKQDAIEADNTLGGVYSSLATSMQKPFANILLTEIKPGILEGIINEDIRLSVVVGTPALGRQADVQNLINASQEAAAIMPVLAQADKRIDPQKVFDIILAGHSVDPVKVFKDDEQLAEEQRADALKQQGLQQIQASTTLADQAQQLQTLQG